MAWALITGGAGGLGRNLARLLLDRGHRVIIADRDSDALSAARDWLGAPDTLECQLLDVADAKAWTALVARLDRQDKAVDILINNACPPSARAALIDIEPENWRSMLDAGLTGAFLGIRSFVPAMVARGKGRVLNIASMAALVPLPRHGDYAAAKAGLVSLSEALRCELAGSGVTVSVACPGAIGRQVGERADPNGPAAAKGRMDPTAGMAHVLDAMLAGDFFIMTHREAADRGLARGRELADAFAAAPSTTGGETKSKS